MLLMFDVEIKVICVLPSSATAFDLNTHRSCYCYISKLLILEIKKLLTSKISTLTEETLSH